MHNMLRVAVIGAGMMGLQHVEAIRRIPGTEVVAVADANGDLARQAGEQLCIPACYTDYRRMLEEQKPNVVHNCTPNHLHFGINAELLRRGIHVYCEKPLGLNSEETGKLCKLAEQSSAQAGVNFNYRQNVMAQEMHVRMADASRWGRTYLIHGRYLQDWLMYDTDFNWRCRSEYAGKSRALADIGSHFFDLVQFITGQKIVRVNATLKTVLPQRLPSPNGQPVDIDTEDEALVMFELADGGPGSLIVSQVAAGTKNDLEITIDGSAYSMSWSQENADKLKISTRDTPGSLLYTGREMLQGEARQYATLPSGHPVGWQDGLRNGIQAFYASIRDHAPVNYATFEDGDYVVRVVEACVQSHQEGRWIQVRQ